MSTVANDSTSSRRMIVSAGTSPRSVVMMYVETAPLGRLPNAVAYVSLPRKYRPLMKLNTSPIGAPGPSGRRRTAISNVAFGLSSIFARRPSHRAGDRRNKRLSSWCSSLFTPKSRAVKGWYASDIIVDCASVHRESLRTLNIQESDDDRAGKRYDHSRHADRKDRRDVARPRGNRAACRSSSSSPVPDQPTGTGIRRCIPGGNNSLKLLAEGLAERGIASLRYDKRGVAASATAMVSEANLRFDMYADDAAGWIRRLRSDPRFSTITVVGHSEGSLLGMLATQRAAADGYVSIAGAGRAADKVLREQLGKQLPPDLLSFSNKALDALLAGHTVDSVPPPLAVAVPAECAAVHDLVVASGSAGRDNAARCSGAHRSGHARRAGSRRATPSCSLRRSRRRSCS